MSGSECEVNKIRMKLQKAKITQEVSFNQITQIFDFNTCSEGSVVILSNIVNSEFP